MGTGEIIIAALTGGVVSSVLQPVINLVNARLEKQKIEDERKYQEQREIYNKKEETYKQAIEYSIRLRNGMNYSRADVKQNPEKFTKIIDDLNSVGLGLSAKIRLYASDVIFERIQELFIFGKEFAYSDKIPSQKDEAKFTRDCDELSKLMKKDLGIK